MPFRRPAFVATLLALSALGHADPVAWPAISPESRPWTYNWWLGSAVDPENLGRELDRYHAAGLGGIHVIPIYGAKGAESRYLAFLSPEWLKMFDWTVDAAARRDLGVDLTTGTGWCFGGPSVSSAECGQRLILVDQSFPADGKLPPPQSPADVTWLSLAAVSAQGARHDLLPLARPDGSLGWIPPAPLADWSVVAVGVQPTRLMVKRAGPGGEGYMINPFDRAAMEHYLAPFHAAFDDSSSHHRPRAVYHDSFEYYDAAWSPELSEAFARRRGYHLEDHWDLLAGHGSPDAVARLWHDYRLTLSDLQIEDVFPLWTRWAAADGMLTRFEAHGAAANLLDLYSLADIPETEMFGHGGPDPLVSRFDENIGGADRDLQVSKFASSSAHVSGHRLVSAETGTWLAEHFHETFEELKCFTDRLFIAGVNHVFYHGNAYSPDDVAWPGWLFYASSELNTRNPLWREFAAFNHYVTRVQSVLQRTRPDADFLLYWPVSDFWSDPRPGVAQLSVHNRPWVPASGRELFARGFAFDYCSDRQIATLASRDHRLATPAGATYRTLVFPSSRFLRPDTVTAALRLAEAGATICFATPVADDVPGLADPASRRAALHSLLPDADRLDPATVNVSPRGSGRVLVGPLEKLLPAARVAPEPAGDAFPGLLVLRQARAGGHAYFLANQALTPVDGWIPLATTASRATVLDPLTDSIGSARIRTTDTDIAVRLRLEPGQSLLVLTTAENPDSTPLPPAPAFAPGETVQTLATGWQVEFIAGGPSLPTPWKPVALATWADGTDPARDAFAGTARYTTHFDLASAALADTPLFLDLGEVCHVARARLNGRDLGVVFMHPYRLALPPGTLRPADNILEVEVTNLGANRIRDLDRHGADWKKFLFVNIAYKPFDASVWPLAPSGLLGPVTLRSANPSDD